jgi:hypothetical protein
MKITLGDDRFKAFKPYEKPEASRFQRWCGDAYRSEVFVKDKDGHIDVVIVGKNKLVRRLLEVYDDQTGQGKGFVIVGDISSKFYYTMKDAALAQLDHVE